MHHGTAQLYDAMYAYFSRDSVAMPGFAHFFQARPPWESPGKSLSWGRARRAHADRLSGGPTVQRCSLMAPAQLASAVRSKLQPNCITHSLRRGRRGSNHSQPAYGGRCCLSPSAQMATPSWTRSTRWLASCACVGDDSCNKQLVLLMVSRPLHVRQVEAWGMRWLCFPLIHIEAA